MILRSEMIAVRCGKIFKQVLISSRCCVVFMYLTGMHFSSLGPF